MTLVHPEYERRRIVSLLHKVLCYRGQLHAGDDAHFNFTASELELVAEGLRGLEAWVPRRPRTPVTISAAPRDPTMVEP